ncbi:DNA polymerase IV [Micrococcales bacterium 31B]|nr:DNA polymerase IV [Micrococcales bacterium 31B]
MNNVRVGERPASIMHVDMDSFFASVEIRDNPDLAGLPVVVAGAGPRGVVAAASYPARAYGIRSAMATARARQLCTGLVVVQPQGEKYSAASRQVMEILQRFTPVIEQVSVDEAFLDVQSVLHFGRSAPDIARSIKRAVRDEVGLTCTIGVATNKTVAKIASAHYKPDGLVVVPDRDTERFLRPRPVRHLSGVGPSLGEKLAKLGVVTIGDLADLPEPDVARLLGAGGMTLQRRARGLDDAVRAVRDRDKSMSAERTFDTDLADLDELRAHILSLSDKVAARLRRHGYAARTIGLKVKTARGDTVSRSHTLPQPTDTTRRIFETTRDLLDVLLRVPGVRPIRLVGVRGESLSGPGLSVPSQRVAFQSDAGPGEQGSLWSAQDAGVARELGAGAAWRDLDSAVDRARGRFGRDLVAPASALKLRSGGTLTKQELGAQHKDEDGPRTGGARA